MTEFRVPNLPKINLTTLDATKLGSIAQDAFYITVGLGVLAVQKLQVRRQELTKRLNVLETQLEGQRGSLDERLTAFEAKLDQVVEQVKTRLPEPADKLLDKAHDVAKTTRKQVFELLSSSTKAAA